MFSESWDDGEEARSDHGGKTRTTDEKMNGVSIILAKRSQRPTKQIYYCSHRAMQWKQLMHLHFQMTVEDVGCGSSGNGE